MVTAWLVGLVGTGAIGARTLIAFSFSSPLFTLQWLGAFSSNPSAPPPPPPFSCQLNETLAEELESAAACLLQQLRYRFFPFLTHHTHAHTHLKKMYIYTEYRKRERKIVIYMCCVLMDSEIDSEREQEKKYIENLV